MRFILCLLGCSTAFTFAVGAPAILINKNFEGGSLGRIEKGGDTQFRLHVEGQCDERGRNRQATWYYFRMDHVADRELNLTLTDFIGEYNDRTNACPMYASTIPMFSYDQKNWRHFPAMDWDDRAKEAMLRFRPASNTVWIAHVQPYTHSDLLRLMAEIDHSPSVRIEVIGKTAGNRDLHLVTVTDFDRPDAGKKIVWLQARQHPWETGTSHVMEGALRFAGSDAPAARELRRKVIFKFVPMMNPDGCAEGWVRFNANGYDLNRHWDQVNLHDKQSLRAMPEIWYVKRAIHSLLDSGQRIDFLINMHNTELGEFLETQVADAALLAKLRRLDANLTEKTLFDPSNKLRVTRTPPNTTNFLYDERGVPAMLLELHTGLGRKNRRQPTAAERVAFGAELITVMGETALELIESRFPQPRHGPAG